MSIQWKQRKVGDYWPKTIHVHTLSNGDEFTIERSEGRGWTQANITFPGKLRSLQWPRSASTVRDAKKRVEELVEYLHEVVA